MHKKSDTMTLTVNGNTTSFQEIKTLTDLLVTLNLDPETVVVEHNTTIIQSESFDSVLLAEGDQIEIIRFVGGG